MLPLWVYHCGYISIGVCRCILVVMSGILSRGIIVLVQNGQDGCEFCWILYRLIRVWMV